MFKVSNCSPCVSNDDPTAKVGEKSTHGRGERREVVGRFSIFRILINDLCRNRSDGQLGDLAGEPLGRAGRAAPKIVQGHQGNNFSLKGPPSTTPTSRDIAVATVVSKSQKSRLEVYMTLT